MLQRAVSSRDFCRPKPQLKGSTCRNPRRRSKTPKCESVSVHPCPKATTEWLYKLLTLTLHTTATTRTAERVTCFIIFTEPLHLDFDISMPLFFFVSKTTKTKDLRKCFHFSKSASFQKFMLLAEYTEEAQHPCRNLFFLRTSLK